ncbi:MAG: hypothetical protein AAF593_05895 [Planctomycetota bacterium]
MTDADLPSPPARSGITVEPLAGGGLAVHLPARGLVRGALGMTFLGGFLTLLCGGLLALTLTEILTGEQTLAEAGLALAGGAVMAAGGGLILGYAVLLGTERARLDLTPSALRITRRSVFGTKQHEITRRVLGGVSTVSTNPRRHQYHTKCLSLTRRQAPDLELFTQRSEDELDYLAELIRSCYQ